MSAGLTAEQMSELEAELHALHDELSEQLSSSKEGAKPVSLDEPIGRVSRMDAIQQQQMTESNRRAAEIRLRLVVAAITALKMDEYGHCEECEEPIGFARLKAKPESRYCISCQTAREQRR